VGRRRKCKAERGRHRLSRESLVSANWV
jgi:hypothetical protein